MSVLVTGAAGFIGYHVARALLARGERVVGVDDLNDYYDVALKQARLARLEAMTGFTFRRADIAERDQLGAALAGAQDAIEGIVHLAAQAGVRHSLSHPRVYLRANVKGHLEMLEAARRLPRLRHFVYASSSSVYGRNQKLPFAVGDPIDRPASLYGATKAAGEAMSAAYAGLYDLPATGLRFFTVYGPWGRPDMAMWIFTKAILEGQPIRLFNRGEMRRDFTYIDDITAGVLAALDRPPGLGGELPHRVYNLGNSRTEELRRVVALLERSLGRKAAVELVDMPLGDVSATSADIEPARRELAFQPATPIDRGIPEFVAWYRDYHRLR